MRVNPIIAPRSIPHGQGAAVPALVLVLLVVAGCGLSPGLAATDVPISPALVPVASTSQGQGPTETRPPADEIAFAFLQAWDGDDYPAMYSLLTPASQAEYSEDLFTSIYRQVVDEATLLSVHPRILAAYSLRSTPEGQGPAGQPDAVAEVVFVTTFETALFGVLEMQNKMALGYVEGRWGVEWSPSLLFPQLSDTTFVRLTEQAPARGNIYDRNGLGLAVQGEIVEVGLIPARIEDETAVLELLSSILGYSAADLRARLTDAAPDPNWYVPLGRISAEAGQAHYETLRSMPGIELRPAWTRSYWQGDLAPHVVGVVGPIPREEVGQWRAQGYQGDEMVGWMGLERWGEAYLAGKRGGRLEIVTAEGRPVAVLAETSPRESSSLYTTFDRQFQKTVQDILGERVGAIAVLEANTGRVLALATYPTFDANLFPTGIDEAQWASLQGDIRRPLLDRATQGLYPPGSVFKIIAMAAGMEKGGLTADSTFTCNGVWTGLGPGLPRTCWLRSGHGSITLADALTTSCDITFYQVGLLLNGLDPDILPESARLCGLGAATGIQVEEEAGLVPDPLWKLQTKGEGWAPGDAVNLAIGQGELLVTPLQAAAMLAAVGNGGTLYRPSVVEMIASDASRPEWTFAPEVVGQLPVSGEELAAIQDSLLKVTSVPQGTAYASFRGLGVTVAGKTGTAESGQGEPHSWFAGYAPASPIDRPGSARHWGRPAQCAATGDPGQRDSLCSGAGLPGAQPFWQGTAKTAIAIAVIVEHAGGGGEIAATLFRQVVEAYFPEGGARVPVESQYALPLTTMGR